MAAEVGREVAGARVREEELLGVDRARRVDPHIESRVGPLGECLRHIVEYVRDQFTGVEAAPPDHALQRLERRALHVAVHQVDGGEGQPRRAGGIGERGVGGAGLGGEGRGGGLHGRVEPVLQEKIAHVLPREREQHVIDERDRRGGALDVEEDPPATEDDHGAALPSPAIHAGPMQSGS